MVNLSEELNHLKKLLYEIQKEGRYCWKMKEKVRWHPLQGKWRNQMYNRLKEEIIATEYEMIIFEQILLYSIEEAKNVQKEFIDN